MSIQNKQTIEAYQKKAYKYLENNIEHAKLDGDRAKIKEKELQDFIKESFKYLSIMNSDDLIINVKKFLGRLSYIWGIKKCK